MLGFERLQTFPDADFTQGPGGMSTYQRLGVRQSIDKNRNRFGRMAVSQGHRNIAEEARVPRTFDWAFLETVIEFLAGHCQELSQSWNKIAFGRTKVLLTCGDGESIPRADVLAIIASEDAISDERTKLARDGAAELDGEIGDAPSSIDDIGSDNGARRTDLKATCASPAEGLAGVLASRSVARISARPFFPAVG